MEDPILQRDDVELKDGYIYFSVQRGQPLLLTVEGAKATVALCHAQRVFNVLVHIADTGKHEGGPGNIFQLVLEMSKLVDHRLKIAVVNSIGWLPLANFAKMVANNRGFNFTIFTSETEALTWLLREEPAQ